MTAVADTPADWEARTIRRSSGLVEHLCLAHGVGHPNPGSALWMAERSRDAAIERAAQAIGRGEEPDPISTLDEWWKTWMSHGCCGCCQADSFPGMREALLHAHGLLGEADQAIGRYRSAVRVAIDMLAERGVEDPKAEILKALGDG